MSTAFDYEDAASFAQSITFLREITACRLKELEHRFDRCSGQMVAMVRGMDGKRLRYGDLIAKLLCPERLN